MKGLHIVATGRYAPEKIVTNDEKYTYERIMLIKAVKIIIANSLKLIGVEAPERM